MKTIAYYFLSDTGGPSITGWVLSVFAKDTGTKEQAVVCGKRTWTRLPSVNAQQDGASAILDLKGWCLLACFL